jgi:hypothetical protein
MRMRCTRHMQRRIAVDTVLRSHVKEGGDGAGLCKETAHHQRLHHLRVPACVSNRHVLQHTRRHVLQLIWPLQKDNVPFVMSVTTQSGQS